MGLKVSILCITYNQVKFIRQTLDSFLMQKTDFDFEILINDDHSTDGTAEILKEYAANNKKIKLNLQKENLYSKGIRGMFARFLLPKARGEYIALCEGDDYWTDPSKLQAQADFLDKNKSYALCFHPVKVVFENKIDKSFIFPEHAKTEKFTVEKLLKKNYIQTNSVMYRRQEYKNLSHEVFPGDWYLHLYHAQFGKIGFINKVMAAYRRHPGGIWWESDKDTDKIWKKHGLSRIALYDALLKIYGENPANRGVINHNIADLLQVFTRLDKNESTKILESALVKFPQVFESYIIHNQKKMREMNQSLIDKNQDNRRLENQLRQRQREIEEIKNSKAWKAAMILRKTSTAVRHPLGGE